MIDIDYTEELKLALLNSGCSNWGAVFNAICGMVDKGPEITLEAGEAIEAFDAVYPKNDGKVWKAVADSLTTMPAIGIAPEAIASGNQGKIRRWGWIDYNESAKTVKLNGIQEGEKVYLSETAGELTKTKPALPQLIGIAKTETVSDVTRILLMPQVADLLTGYDLANYSTDGGIPFILKATIANGNTVTIHNANAPFKYRVLDAWSVNISADGGTWKVTDGTNDITDTVTVAANDKDVDRASQIDDSKHEIAAGGTLKVIGDGVTLDAEVYIQCMRVA